MPRTSHEQLRFVLAIAAVAAGAALFAIVFRSSLAFAYRSVFRANNVVEAITGLPRWMRVVVPVSAAFVAGLITRARAAPAQGVSNVMEAVALGRIQLSLRTTVSRAASSWLSIAGGMSIGREGPLIEFGGALAAAIGRRLRVSLTHTRILVASGTAAGFAAAYNTPFASVLFVLETIAGIASSQLLLPVMTATVIATALTRVIAGEGPIYGERAFRFGSYAELLAFAGLGAAAALSAAAFKYLLKRFESSFERLGSQPFRATAGGLVVGALAVWIPTVAGNGYEPLNDILDATTLPAAVGILVIAKVIATSSSVACGVPGGIFTPMLLVGASVGTVWAHVIAAVMTHPPNAGSYALVGMAATTAASVHAPVTAAVMVFELSGDYPIVLPLLVATVISTSVSRLLGSESIYETELRRRGLALDVALDRRLLTAHADSRDQPR